MEARFRVSLQGQDELSNFFGKSEKGARAFASNLGGALKSAAKDVAAFGFATAKSLTSMATGNLGIAQVAKNTLAFRDSLSALATAADLSEEGIEGLRKQIHGASIASNQMQDDVTAALGAFVAKTGDLKTARDNLALYGKVATATGASLMDVANVGVELKQKLGIENQAEAMAILVKQAKLGAIEFKDMASVGPKILAAAASVGAHGEAGIRSAGAAVQVIASGFGGKGQGAGASVSYENMVATLQKTKTRSKIEQLGIQVQGRDASDIFMDVIRKTGGDTTALREIFRTQQAFRGVSAFARDYDKTTGKFAKFDQFKNVDGGVAALDADFARRAQTGQARLNAAQIKIAEVLDNKVGPVFENMAKHAELISGAFQWGADHLKTTIAGFGVGLVGWKMLMAQISGGGKGGGVAGLLARGGVQHVWVDNLPGGAGLPSGGGGSGSPGGGAGGWASRALTGATGLGLAGSAALLGATAVAAAPLLYTMHQRKELIEKLHAENERQVSDRRLRRSSLARHGSGPVFSSGGSMGSLDDAKQADIKNEITVVIADGKATVTDDGGTRSAATLERRGYAQGGRRGR